MIIAGIDSGSRAIKVVLWDGDNQKILAIAVADQGLDPTRRAQDALAVACDQAEIRSDAIATVVATGYGRDQVDFADRRITEITCHARGVAHLAPQARTIIDIGGQDSKVIHIEAGGRVRDFSMNDRCAAGTGRFLEVVARNLETPLMELGALAAQSQTPAPINSMCVVFAETEIIGLLASGTARIDIVAGVQKSIADRVAAMAGRHVTDPVYFAGGVAQIPGMAEALSQALTHPVQVARHPQLTGALGAALLAV